MSGCTDSPPPPPRLAEGRRWQPGAGHGGRAQSGAVPQAPLSPAFPRNRLSSSRAWKGELCSVCRSPGLPALSWRRGQRPQQLRAVDGSVFIQPTGAARVTHPSET